MKKAVCIAIAAIMVLGACSGEKYSEDTIDAMEVAIEIADKVLANETTPELAERDLEKIIDSMDISYPDGKEARDLIWNVETCINAYKVYTTGVMADTEDCDTHAKESLEILEIARNNLYEALYGN